MCLYTDVSGQSTLGGCECLPAFTVRLCGLPAPVFMQVAVFLCTSASHLCVPVCPRVSSWGGLCAWLDTGGWSVCFCSWGRVSGVTAWSSMCISRETAPTFLPIRPSPPPANPQGPSMSGASHGHLSQPLTHSWLGQPPPASAHSSSLSDAGLQQVQAQRQRWKGEGESYWSEQGTDLRYTNLPCQLSLTQAPKPLIAVCLYLLLTLRRKHPQ